MTTENTNPLERSIALGFQVEAFLQSDVGRYLVQRADEEIEEAVEELKRVSPEHTAVIRALQGKIHVAESIQFWLAEAIQEGANAMQELNEPGA